MGLKNRKFWETGIHPITGYYISGGPPGSSRLAFFERNKKSIKTDNKQSKK